MQDTPAGQAPRAASAPIRPAPGFQGSPGPFLGLVLGRRFLFGAFLRCLLPCCLLLGRLGTGLRPGFRFRLGLRFRPGLRRRFGLGLRPGLGLRLGLRCRPGLRRRFGL